MYIIYTCTKFTTTKKLTELELQSQEREKNNKLEHQIQLQESQYYNFHTHYYSFHTYFVKVGCT